MWGSGWGGGKVARDSRIPGQGATKEGPPRLGLKHIGQKLQILKGGRMFG